jgi:hypothetical protein
MIPGFLVLFVIAAWGGLLDPVAVWLEKRRHELWVSTDAYSVKVWANNNVEVNKAVRAIQRAQERLRDAQEFCLAGAEAVRVHDLVAQREERHGHELDVGQAQGNPDDRDELADRGDDVPRASHQPATMNQITLPTADRDPASGFGTTVRPNGQGSSSPSGTRRSRTGS